MDHILRIRILFISFFFTLSFSAIATNTYVPNCTNGQPSDTSPRVWSHGTYGIHSSAYDGCQAAIPLVPFMVTNGYKFNRVELSANLLAAYCYYQTQTGTTGPAATYAYFNKVCPIGYVADSQTSTTDLCVLSNASLISCPTPTCTASQSIGFGNAYSGDACFNGCVIKQKGISAAALDTSNNQIGEKQVEWEMTGGTCTSGVTTPIHSDETIHQDNCIQNADRILCLSKEKPGCGTVNGQEFCADKILQDPKTGRCNFLGSSGYVCSNGDQPPPIKGENPPSGNFAIDLPVQDSNGSPTNGLSPTTNGGISGGTAPGQVGNYPGPSGNGTGGTQGTGNEPGQSKNQCETHPGSIGCQTSSNYWASFKEKSKEALGESLGIPGDAPTVPTVNRTVIENPEFASSSSCPNPKNIVTRFGSYAISYIPLCDLATSVRPIVLILAAIAAAYIILGQRRGANE